MSRLYYDQPTSTLEVSPTGELSLGTTTSSQNNKASVGSYLEKVAKLIPSEIVAAYLAMFGLAPVLQLVDTQLSYWIIFGFCQVLTPIYIYLQAEKGKHKWVHILISFISFTIWAYVTTGKELVPAYYDAALGSILLIAFSLISAIVPLKR